MKKTIPQFTHVRSVRDKLRKPGAPVRECRACLRIWYTLPTAPVDFVCRLCARPQQKVIHVVHGT
jgi:hypothetical protein